MQSPVMRKSHWKGRAIPGILGGGTVHLQNLLFGSVWWFGVERAHAYWALLEALPSSESAAQIRDNSSINIPHLAPPEEILGESLTEPLEAQ